MTQRTKDLGNVGETVAADYLRSIGWKIVAQNYRVRSAEIDLIAEVDGTIIFIEVKTRRSNRYGAPVEAVTQRKQQKIIEAASIFLQQPDYSEKACRFDVIEVFAIGDDVTKWRLNLIENAFEVC